MYFEQIHRRFQQGDLGWHRGSLGEHMLPGQLSAQGSQEGGKPVSAQDIAEMSPVRLS